MISRRRERLHDGGVLQSLQLRQQWTGGVVAAEKFPAGQLLHGRLEDLRSLVWLCSTCCPLNRTSPTGRVGFSSTGEPA